MWVSVHLLRFKPVHAQVFNYHPRTESFTVATNNFIVDSVHAQTVNTRPFSWGLESRLIKNALFLLRTYVRRVSHPKTTCHKLAGVANCLTLKLQMIVYMIQIYSIGFSLTVGGAQV